jgi:hypothetical protein
MARACFRNVELINKVSSIACRCFVPTHSLVYLNSRARGIGGYGYEHGVRVKLRIYFEPRYMVGVEKQ